jgi:hypothetical protein
VDGRTRQADAPGLGLRLLDGPPLGLVEAGGQGVGEGLPAGEVAAFEGGDARGLEQGRLLGGRQGLPDGVGVELSLVSRQRSAIVSVGLGQGGAQRRGDGLEDVNGRAGSSSRVRLVRRAARVDAWVSMPSMPLAYSSNCSGRPNWGSRWAILSAVVFQSAMCLVRSSAP